MKEAIQNFAAQFAYRPVIENGAPKRYTQYVVAGMGGSALAADCAKELYPALPIVVHKNYGLPSLTAPKHTLIIASSYSGNTEETLSAFAEARKRGIATAAIAVGGKLLVEAKKARVSFIQLPNTGIQPRSALGFSITALFTLLGEREALVAARSLARTLRPEVYESKGRALAKKLQGHVPVIYASAAHAATVYNWKIKCNETGKIPAFANIFPELNHNEMTGFDVRRASKKLSSRFHFLFLHDRADDLRVQKRMKVLAQLYRDRGLPVTLVPMEGATPMHKMFSSLVLADWFAYYTAEQYELESEQVPMVEEFKRLIE